MRVSVCLGAILIPEYLDSHSGYSAPRSRIARIYSGIYSYSGISQTNAPLYNKILNQEYLQKNRKDVLQTWHQKCTSQKKRNDTYHVAAITTVLAPVSFCVNENPHLQPFKVRQILPGTHMVPISS